MRDEWAFQELESNLAVMALTMGRAAPPIETKKIWRWVFWYYETSVEGGVIQGTMRIRR